MQSELRQIAEQLGKWPNQVQRELKRGGLLPNAKVTPGPYGGNAKYEMTAMTYVPENPDGSEYFIKATNERGQVLGLPKSIYEDVTLSDQPITIHQGIVSQGEKHGLSFGITPGTVHRYDDGRDAYEWTALSGTVVASYRPTSQPGLRIDWSDLTDVGEMTE